MRPAYLFRLELFDAQNRPVHEIALADADFHRAVETAFFDGLRHGLYAEYDLPLSRARVEPRFEGGNGSPRAAGFDVILPASHGEHRVGFDSDFFDARATRIGLDLVREKKQPEGSKLLYQLAAYLDGRPEPSKRGLRITLEDTAARVPLRPGSLTDFGTLEPWDNPDAEDVTVLIPRRVLEEAVEEARAAPEREVGGVLLGHLRRDAETGEVFLQVTCQVPAEQTEATSISVTFTPATWSRVREVVQIRGEGEVFAGWVHSHPFRFCKDCPVPTPAECLPKVLFYSADDEFLMELTFAQPFMVGLLTAVEPKLDQTLGHLPVKLYGWRNGKIEPRGFHVIDE